MLVQVSGDGGLSWVGLEVVGPVAEADGGWYQRNSWSARLCPNKSISDRFISSRHWKTDLLWKLRLTVFDCWPPCIDDGPSCPGDVDGNGSVEFADLVSLLSAWGSSCTGCPEDVDGSGTVEFSDLVGLLSAFGPCP